VVPRIVSHLSLVGLARNSESGSTELLLPGFRPSTVSSTPACDRNSLGRDRFAGC